MVTQKRSQTASGRWWVSVELRDNKSELNKQDKPEDIDSSEWVQDFKSESKTV